MATDMLEKYKSMQFAINNPLQVMELFDPITQELNTDLLLKLKEQALNLPTFENNQHRLDEFKNTNHVISKLEVQAALATCPQDTSAYAVAEKLMATNSNYAKVEPVKISEDLDENPLNYNYLIQQPVIKITGIILAYHNIYKSVNTTIPSRTMYMLHTYKGKNGIVDIPIVPVSLRMSIQSMVELTKKAHLLIPVGSTVTVNCEKNAVKKYLEILDIQPVETQMATENIALPKEQEMGSNA